MSSDDESAEALIEEMIRNNQGEFEGGSESGSESDGMSILLNAASSHLTLDEVEAQFAAIMSAKLSKAARVERLNRRLRDQSTLFGSAAALGDVALMVRIAEAGADVHAMMAPASEEFEAPALHFTAERGHVDAITALLDTFGCTVDDRDSLGLKAIVYAVSAGKIDAVRLLLDRGASPFDLTPDGLTLVELAALAGHSDIVHLLLERAPPLLDAALQRPVLGLSACCEAELVDVLTQVLDRGFDANTHNDDGITALECACDNANEPGARLLLERGARLSGDNMTLFKAVAAGSLPIVELLLQRGASAKTPNLLQLAASVQHVGIVRALLAAGADARPANEDGWTALHHAANGSVEMVRLLLPLSDLEAENANGTALLAACDSKHAERDEVLRVLLDAGANVHATPPSGISPLSLLAMSGRTAAMQMLVDKGVDIHSKNSCGLNALYYACEGEQIELVKFLTSQGIEVDAQSTGLTSEVGETAFYVACENTDNVELVAHLIKCGANVNHRTKAGTSPLMAAVRNGKFHVVRFLLEHGVDLRARPPLLDLAIRSDATNSLCALIAHGLHVSFDHLQIADLFYTKNPFPFLLLTLIGLGKPQSFANPELAVLHAYFHHEMFDVLSRAGMPGLEEMISVAPKLTNELVQQLRTQKLHLINRQAREICFALQPLSLPALLTMMIIDEVCPLAPFVTDHLKWTMIAKIKHFHDK